MGDGKVWMVIDESLKMVSRDSIYRLSKLIVKGTFIGTVGFFIGEILRELWYLKTRQGSPHIGAFEEKFKGFYLEVFFNKYLVILNNWYLEGSIFWRHLKWHRQGSEEPPHTSSTQRV